MVMKDVSSKIDSLRHAFAIASLRVGNKTIELIKRNKVPKGNVFEIARSAAILAAKKTSDLIPFCHQVPLDLVDVDFELSEQKILIKTQAKAIWRTGVEMEALTAASIAALTIYDMLKPIDEVLEITSIKLIEKRGGKTEWIQEFEKPLRSGVIVASDSVAKGKREDKSGKAIIKELENQKFEVIEYLVLPDDFEVIKKELIRLTDNVGLDLIITSGGTGLSTRDLTVEATKSVIQRETPGISEASRIYGAQRTPYAMLSRGISGIRGKSLIINLPGGLRGVRESIDALFPWVFHAFNMIGGGGHAEE